MNCLFCLAYAGLAAITAYKIAQGIIYLYVAPVALEALAYNISGQRKA